jgi:hypothetical protein
MGDLVHQIDLETEPFAFRDVFEGRVDKVSADTQNPWR